MDSKLKYIFNLFVIVDILSVTSESPIPTNFFGSTEIYSGYLSNSDWFVDAFTLGQDHPQISGSIQEVERELQSRETQGKFVRKLSQKF